ncbi:hypothetical protein QYF61_027346 [Mycteria americana]|uniref:Reverse transcriptase n=1 Tax=Mycteria americana TaxID=33587 RepID=A0AAN7MJ81_MYCAM|nr:hypothetical protein QYF61_027346 [Mycteria americana]
MKKINSIPAKTSTEDPFIVGLLHVEEQQVSIATMMELIRRLESQGVISKTQSPFNSPIWPVQKSDGTALEQGAAPEHLQYNDDIIVWGNTAEEVFEKGKRIIQILLKANFAITQSKIKGPS